MTLDIAGRGRRFRDLHSAPGAFVMPNPWDAGTARLVEHGGFAAIATTSAGHAFSSGMPDGRAALDAVLAHVAALSAAVDLPLSADLEDGFADAPAGVADTIAAVAAHGAVGASIEDRRRSGELYDADDAAERVAAAADAARSLPFPFTLTARCECFLAGRPDLGEAIRRLQSYEAAGADVLYAPGLRTRDEIAAVVAAVDRPVNVVVGLQSPALTVAELSALGVRRISLGSALSRAALGAVRRALDEIAGQGTFGFAADAVPYAEIDREMAR